ncbi:MAG TPA: transglutaminase-like domain-containing protein [Chitinophagaceae bacterium]
MKRLTAFLFAATLAASAFAQTTYKNLPLIKASTNLADYRVDGQWSRGQWSYAPEAVPDVLLVPTFSRTVSFAFYTDRDSISFPLSGKMTRQFYVLTADGKYALTEVRGFDYDPVHYDAAAKSPGYKFWYETGVPNVYLNRLKAQYSLDKVVEGATSDSAKALRILKWSHDQWEHNGMNEPKKRDALSILEEARTEGKQFRCVEYGIVGAAALNALGLPARVLALKMKDVETIEGGAGHVLLEVYLPDLKKWVLLDGQWDAMPVLNGVPLNAVELQQAIATNYDALEVRSLSGTPKADWVRFVYSYLYYMDVSFDNREGRGAEKESDAGKKSLMLVPQDAKEPKVFQKANPINYVHYTRSLADFYAPPVQ